MLVCGQSERSWFSACSKAFFCQAGKCFDWFMFGLVVTCVDSSFGALAFVSVVDLIPGLVTPVLSVRTTYIYTSGVRKDMTLKGLRCFQTPGFITT